ncbi:McrB family protein [Cyclobacterium salsum]|uniref:McrB family protein n=1 Tax=Cyclobacterium salsum TaxID=2666329 RepID=UPI001391F390|nr:AAA family ATPase [Cyclobacterium salsum]
MDIKKVSLTNGEYLCDIDISVEEWKIILQDENLLNDNYKDALIKFYTEPDHKSTCKALGEKYNVSPQSFNGTITNFAKAVQKKLNRFEIIGIDGKPTYWIIPMNGKHISDGLFEWSIRQELVTAIMELDLINKNNEKQLEEYRRFKKLLEYFVTHLEWVNSEDKNSKGFDNYIKPLTDANNFKATGQGYSGGNIQIQISNWDKYSNGKICINIQPNFGSYKSSKSYLNWEGTGINVIAKWNKENIESLLQEEYQYWLNPPKRKDLKITRSLDSLGLFDNNEEVTKVLIDFFDNFKNILANHNIKQQVIKHMQALEPYINLLTANYNLVLTGAPGTGKTFLAREIAKALNAEIGFIQFHPSYDYTDLVEGLRPTPPDENGNIGFERKDGVFKEFCKKALKENISNEVDNFEETWEKLIELVKTNLSNDKLLKIGSWEYGLSTKDSLKYSSLNTPSQYSFTITKQNVYDAYQNKKARPSGAFQRDMEDVVDFMKTQLQLKDYQEGAILKEAENKKFVFIIDEINRGEISKIFGELFFLLDPSYRGIEHKVQTQYSNLIESGDVFSDGFFVPENVYIIGTMNDIDRSVESFDFAMRRRFAWKEIKAIDRITMWDGVIDDWKAESLKRMTSINTKIESIQGLGSAFHIGPAYFLKLKNYNGGFEQLWENHLVGVLFEYLRGLPEREKRLKELFDAYNNALESPIDVENN